jgi:putative transposase
VDYAQSQHSISFRQACILFSLSSSVYYYQPVIKDDTMIIEKLSLLSERHPRWGFWLMYHYLRKLGFEWNHKRVYRVYTQMRLNLRNKRKKRLPSRVAAPLLRPVYPNVTWSIDFMHDTLSSGKSIRSFNVIDDFNREALLIVIDSSLPSTRIIAELEKLIEWRGKPDKIRSDNGPEFIASAMEEWCSNKNIQWEYIQPGKPTQNSLIERFNRTFRQDVLDSYSFDNMTNLRKYAHAWMWMYNNQRPHSALQYLTPVEFLLKYGKLTGGKGKFPTFQQDINIINENENYLKILNVNVAI